MYSTVPQNRASQSDRSHDGPRDIRHDTDKRGYAFKTDNYVYANPLVYQAKQRHQAALTTSNSTHDASFKSNNSKRADGTEWRFVSAAYQIVFI